jgi:DNA-binding CsgD family transcriptional regulator
LPVVFFRLDGGLVDPRLGWWRGGHGSTAREPFEVGGVGGVANALAAATIVLARPACTWAVMLGAPHPPHTRPRLLAAFADSSAGPAPAQPIEPLTSMEEELLILVARGRTNSEIADELHISISTVKTTLANLMRKLDGSNRVEIAMWAHETGRIRN